MDKLEQTRLILNAVREMVGGDTLIKQLKSLQYHNPENEWESGFDMGIDKAIELLGGE